MLHYEHPILWIGPIVLFQIEEAHTVVAQEGQSVVPNLDDDVNTHFVAFSHVDGSLYELDGRKEAPINHGPCSAESLLQVGPSQITLPIGLFGRCAVLFVPFI